jgi:pyruvate/2-oxoglutarate dehydrogenase complex dihydrolipoamide dehydrogenase (E3) component
MERVRSVRAGISPHDSAKRFSELGIDVFLGEGRFVDSEVVEVGGARLRFKHAVIASGARAVQPDVPGLSEAGFLTNETVFNLTSLPRRLAVNGSARQSPCFITSHICSIGRTPTPLASCRSNSFARAFDSCSMPS